MELCFIHYRKNIGTKHFYFIPLAQTKTKLIGMKTRDDKVELISYQEAKLIKEKAKELDAMEYDDKYKWFSANINNFSKGYATLLNENIIDIFNYRI